MNKNQIKKVIVFLIIFISLISLVIANQNHPADEISPGDFSNGGDYIFPTGTKIGIGRAPQVTLDIVGSISNYGASILIKEMEQRSTNNYQKVLDNSTLAGLHNSMTIGADGMPVIAYHDNSLHILKLYKCDDVDCSSGTARVLDNSTADTGDYSSIAIGSDGYPVISYFDEINDNLRLYHCNNVDCTSGTNNTVDSIGDVGRGTSITIGANGFPIIVYYDNTNGDLKFYQCSNIDCSFGSARTLYSTNNVGSHNAITIGSDGYPVISYYDSTNGDLRIFKCTDTACNSGKNYTPDTGGDVGTYSSITMGSDGYAVIAYFDVTNQDLKFYKCSNIDCSSGTVRTLDSAPTTVVGWYPSIIIGPEGYPIITYYVSDLPKGRLGFFKCGDLSCSFGLKKNLTYASQGGAYPEISIGSDGLPIISYYNGELNIFKCSNPFCVPYWSRR